jgi:4-amino-4-deoxy-L-arabinose transferase-like glycosyltransferase
MDAARARRLILVAAGIGLLLRLAFGLLYWVDKPLTQDEREYLALAGSVIDGNGFTYPDGHETGTGQRFSRAPGYVALLAAIGARTAPAAPARVKVVNALFGAVTVWIIGLLAVHAGGARAGVLAAAIAAGYPPLVWLPAYVFSDSLYMPLALGCITLLLMAQAHCARQGRHGVANALVIAGGLMAGSAALVRSAMLLFVPLAALWFLRRRQWPFALAFCVAAALVVSPWTLRNIQTHGRLIVVAADGGVTFWTGNHPLARGEGDLAANPELKRAEITFRQAHGSLPAEDLEPLYYADALQRIRDNPRWWLRLLAAKAMYTVVPIGPSYTLHSPRYLMASVIAYGLIAPLGIAGLVRLLRTGRGTPLLLLAGSVLLTALIFFPQERFRIPVLDPTLIIGASILLTGVPARR